MSPSHPAGARPRVRGSLGAEDGILCLDDVGLLPLPTAVFFMVLLPLGCDMVGELEMMLMSVFIL